LIKSVLRQTACWAFLDALCIDVAHVRIGVSFQHSSEMNVAVLVWLDKLEMTQRRAARFVKNIPFRRSKPPVSISAMVSDLGWEPLQTRRLHSRLTIMYKITNGLVEVPQEYHPAPRPQNSARRHPRQFQRFQPTVDTF